MRVHAPHVGIPAKRIPAGPSACCALALVFLLQLGPAIHADSVSPEQFLAEAPLAWERYQAYADTLSGRIHCRRFLGTKPMADSVVECKASGQNRLAVVEAIPAVRDLRESLKGPREGNVYGKNRAYSFRMKRPNPESPWVLVGLDIPKTGARSNLDLAFAEFARYKGEAVCAMRLPLSKLVKEPTFRVLKITPVPSGAEVLQEVTFSNVHELNKNKRGSYAPVQSGTLLLDPKHDWCLRSYKVRFSGSDTEGTESAQFEYEFPADGHAMLKECRSTQEIHRWSSPNVPADIPNKIEMHITYQLSAGERWPDKDFTLTAFGLPEPPGTDWRPPMPWYIWVGLAAIVLILAGAVFTWLKRRAALA